MEKLFNYYKKNMKVEKTDKENIWKNVSSKIEKKKSFLSQWLGIGVFTLILIFAGTGYLLSKNPNIIKDTGLIDDWNYSPSNDEDKSISSGVPTQMAMESADLGFAVGGSKDINNFRENIKNNYLPIESDLTYEGLFYGYNFDTGKSEPCTELFCPSYSLAVSNDPISEEKQYFMTVGLNSNIKEEDFERKKLNLVIVLDISGSMSSAFDSYYYDQFGNYIENKEASNKTKMEIANNSVVKLLSNLNDDDRIGIVLFDDISYKAKPISIVSKTDMNALNDNILEITPQGGTNMEAGISEATKMLEEYSSSDSNEYENRIIFLTDAMPNTGVTDENGLFGMTEKNSENNIYTTFIGIGVDFNSELVEGLTKVKGANYLSVHNEDDFYTRMDEEFDFLVTPLVFNLNLKFESEGFKISKVYGSPEADESTGEIMKVNTLFPSKTEEGETKGGIILLQLEKIDDNDTTINLSVNYEDREGQDHSNNQEIEFYLTDETYSNSGIRKAILLTRYANLMKNWVIYERSNLAEEPVIYDCTVNTANGIIPPCEFSLGEWERTSNELIVSENYKTEIEKFISFFKTEILELDDDTLNQEVELMEEMIK